MFIAYVVVGALLALALIASAGGKLTRAERIVDSLTSLDVPQGMFPFLAACEIAGAVGLLVGIWWAPLGVAAATGVVLYFVGAVGAHLRKRDFKGAPNAGLLLVIAAAVLALRLLSP